MSHLRLYVIVFISGASVLALEILGTRILGPFYGVSLFLWSALITVTLAALSVGYAVGGHWADRGPTLGRLGLLLAVAGVWVLVIPFLRSPVLRATEPLGLRVALLTTATLLFGPPLTLLGMVSPYAIRLKAQSLDRVGRTAGNLYAVSTVASVISAVAMGFFLIPSLGVTRLTYAIGVSLLVACALAVARSRRPALAGVAVLLAGGLVAMATDAREQADPDRGLVAARQSPYAEIRVVDTRGGRHLLIDGGVHSMMDLTDGESWMEYLPAVDVLKFLFEEPGRLLLLGLGGGSIAKRFAAEGWDVDAVEIDPVIAEMAREHFDLTPKDCTLSVMDGRQYLLRNPDRYDFIVVDVFGSSSIPFHLTTVEAFALMASRLQPEGVLAMNVETVGWHHPLVASLAASLQPNFPHVLALPVVEPPDALGNVVMVASRRAMEFDEYELLPRPYDHLDVPHEHWWTVQMNHAWDNRFEPDTSSGVVLTDDLNPVDLWSEAINLAARDDLHEYLSEVGGGW